MLEKHHCSHALLNLVIVRRKIQVKETDKGKPLTSVVLGVQYANQTQILSRIMQKKLLPPEGSLMRF